MRERSRIRTIVEVVALMFAGLLLSSLTSAQAGKNANGALIVHTNDAVSYTATGNYCGVNFDHPGTCEQAGTRTDKAEDEPAVIWFLAAFPDTSSPAVTVVYFGVDHNLPPDGGYFQARGFCAPSNSLEVPDPGWPEHPEAAGNSVASPTAWLVQAGNLFPFYWFAAYGFEGAYLGTAINPVGGYAGFVDDSNPGVMEEVTKFGKVRWYAAGSNACPSRGEDGGEGEEEGDQGPGGEGESSWLDGDGESMWVRDCILARLRDDLPMPPREPTEELGIPAFDALGAELGLVSVRRLITLDDETCAGYPGINRMMVLRFGVGTDELDAARRYAELAEVTVAQPNYAAPAVGLSAYANDPGFSRQWHLMGPGATSCLDPDPNITCCIGCDIGVDVAWQYTRGDSRVRVAFIDTGADMQHPDLFDAYAFNPDEDANDNDRADLCDYPIGDLDGIDAEADPDSIIDDVLLGWALDSSGLPTWKHKPTHHGTSVAGLLGAITNNGTGVASAAGGDNDSLGVAGIRLIQFSAYEQVTSDFQIGTFVYAHNYGARVYTSSLSNLDDGSFVEAAVDSLSGDMLFMQAAGNDADTTMIAFSRLPNVMAVGGYDGITGGRWMATSEQVPSDPLGSSYGPKLELMGPAADAGGGTYERMVMASTRETHNFTVPYVCNPNWPDQVGCFGGTSAAAPIVASAAALLFSYSEQHGLGLTPARVRTILNRTAEDIRCDPSLSQCDCSDTTECVELLGRDVYSGFGRVDVGRALTLPVAILDPLDSLVVARGETMHLAWEAFGNLVGDGDMGPGAHFELHYLVPDEGTFDWREIDDDIPWSARSYDWVVPGDVPPGVGRRIRLTVVDSASHANQDYSDRFQVIYGPASVESDRSLPVVQGVTPNPSSGGARIRYLLRAPADVRVHVVDVAGRQVRTLAQGRQPAGSWSLDWDGRDDRGNRVSSGIYFVRLDLGSHVRSVRLVRIR